MCLILCKFANKMIIIIILFQSMINFLNDPLGEMPWEEEDGTEDVRHVNTNMVGKSRLCSKEN